MPIPEKNVEVPQPPATGSSPWVGSNGLPANPNSPAGGGGPGFFSSGIAGMSGNDSNPIPHPDSPVGDGKTIGQWDVDRLHEGGVALDAKVIVTDNTPKPNAPPVTKTETFKVTRSNSTEDILITVNILADGTDSSSARANHAYIKVTPTDKDPVALVFEFDTDTVDDKGKVLKKGGFVTSIGEVGPGGKKTFDKMVFKPTIDIQIFYGSNVSATSASAYGRGTTDKDIKDKNTTLGFHEACHLDDSKAYYKDISKFPGTFAGKVGDTKDSFKAKVDAWMKAWETYFTNEAAASRQKTDETGSTLSAYIAKNPGYQH